MKPYYEHNGITIYHGDCREILPELPRPDFIFADPPYGVGFGYAQGPDGRIGYEEKIDSWFSIMKCDQVCVTPGIDNICLWPQPRWVICWLKANSMGANRLSGPKAVSRNLWEPMLWYGRYPKNPPSRDIIHAPLGSGDGDNGHPCPKPLSLISKIVAAGTNEGDSVIDPFCGSGTTLRACKDLGRKSIGIEISEEYCEIGAKRLSQEVLQF